MIAALGLADKVVRLDRGFAKAKIPHAFGGALALAYYATPRATVDIDVNIFLPAENYRDVARVLARIGVDTIPEEREALDRGQVRGFWGQTPIDLFFSYDEIHDDMRLEARTVPFGSSTIPILAPEHLLIAKAAFNRPKDWLDIEQMLTTVDLLDLAKIRTWMAHLVGMEDARMVRLEELIDRLRGDR